MKEDLRELLGGKTPRSLQSVSIPGAMRVLFLAAHPDDFDSVGVTLRWFRDNGNPIELGVVRTGSGIEDSYRDFQSPGEKAGIREEEQRRSCRFFGLPDACLHFLDLENDEQDQPLDIPENRRHLREFMRAKQPDIVFLLHGNDTNSGHRTVYSMFRHIAPQHGRPLAALLIRDVKTIKMRMDLYQSFGREEAQWKAELLRFHDSQHQRNLNTRGYGFDERILGENQRIARELSLSQEYAEAFEAEFYGTKETESQQEPDLK